MTYEYALQIAAVALAMSILGLGGIVIAARNFDRNTRKAEAHKGE